MQVITITHNKGGVSKSTIVFNLYAYYIKEGLKVGIIDVDIQGSISEAKKVFKDEFSNVEILPTPKNWQDIINYDYDIILIDTPPFKMFGISEIIKISNIVVIPTRCGLYDRLAVIETIKAIEKVKADNQNLVSCIVITQTIPNNPYTEEMKVSFAETGVSVLEETIGHRIAFSRSLMSSKGVFSEKDIKARKEVENLGNKLIELLR